MMLNSLLIFSAIGLKVCFSATVILASPEILFQPDNSNSRLSTMPHEVSSFVALPSLLPTSIPKAFTTLTNIGSWENVLPVTNASFYSVAASSTGQYLYAVNYGKKLYNSSDFGQHWSTLSLDFPAYVVACDSSGAILVMGDASGPQMYKSTNYGSHWTNYSMPSAVQSTAEFSQAACDSTCTRIGLVVEDTGTMAISSDGGSHWEVFYGGSSLPWVSVTFSSSGETAYATRVNSGVYVSSNYGSYFSHLADSYTASYSVACSSSGSVVCIGGYNLLSTSHNSGISFNYTETLENYSATYVASDSQGKILFGSVNHGLYQSFNSGSLWTEVISDVVWQDVASNSYGNYAIAGSTNGLYLYYGGPVSAPTARPSTRAPSVIATIAPTVVPSTQRPSAVPTFKPTAPTVQPTTSKPTLRPTIVPTVLPTTRKPSVNPTVAPTTPTMQPTTRVPTVAPSIIPTIAPTTRIPSVNPTVVPTTPTVQPSTRKPTVIPTLFPSIAPNTQKPSAIPTIRPSIHPSVAPTISKQPITALPSDVPTFAPTVTPSFTATSLVPTVVPSAVPTFPPSAVPTHTSQPSVFPTSAPSTALPTFVPTVAPTITYGEFVSTDAVQANWSCIASSTNGQVVLAAVYHGSIFVSIDYGSTFQTTDASNNSWVSVVSDESGNILFAVSLSGVISRSVDGNYSHWSPCVLPFTGTSKLQFSSVAISSNGQLVFAASTSGSVVMSNNSGVSWTVNAVLRDNIASIACASSGQYVVFASKNEGIFTSSNYGATFAYSTMNSVTDWSSIAISSDGSYCVASVYGGGIYVSSDYGASWTLTDLFYFADWIAVTCDSSCQTIYAIMEFGGIYGSTDYGSSWQCVSGDTAVSWSGISSSGSGQVAASVLGGGIFMPIVPVTPAVVTDSSSHSSDSVATAFAATTGVLLGLLAIATGGISVLMRKKEAKFISKLGSTNSALMTVGMSSFNIATSFYNLIAPSVSTSSGGYVTLLLSKIIVFGGWCIIVTAFLFPQPDTSGKHIVPLAMLYHKPSLQKTYNIKIGVKLHIKYMQVYGAALLLTALDLPQIRLLPWLKTNFTAISNGYPDMLTLRVSMYGQFLASLLQTIASIVTAAEDAGGSQSAVGQSAVLVMISIVQLLWTFFNLVLYIQAARSNSLKLVVVNEADLAKIRALDESDECNELNDDYSPQAISDTLNKQLKEEAPALEMARINPLFTTQIFSEEPDLETGVKVVNTTGYTSTIKHADRYVEVLKQQLVDHGIRPVEFLPLDDIKSELAVLFEKANAGQPYDEARLDHLLLCMDLNPEFKAEKVVENKQWREKVMPFLTVCLEEMRGYVPPHIFSASVTSLVQDNMSKDLAKRLVNKKCLWLIRQSRREIERTHEAELTGRFNPSGQGLDIVELGAVYVSLPEKFFNDTSGKKQKWRDNIEQQFKQMFTEYQSGRLPKDKQRNFVYKSAEPLYTGRETLHESGTVSSEGAFGPRISFMTMARPGIVGSSSNAILHTIGRRVPHSTGTAHIPAVFRNDSSVDANGDADREESDRTRELSVISEGSERDSTDSTRSSRKGSAFSMSLEGLLSKRFSKPREGSEASENA